MNAKCKQEKNDEQVAFAEFSTWCNMEQAQLKESIKKGGESIELLGASIEKLGNEAKVLGEEISTLQSNVAEFEADMKASEKQRAKVMQLSLPRSRIMLRAWMLSSAPWWSC